MKLLYVIAIGYLLGSIPFSHLFPKLKGQDVRKGGTKNIGASNALAVAGPLIGLLALIGDIGKGYISVFLARSMLASDPNMLWGMTLAGLAAILGHIFSIFLKFKGGKGVATMGGGLLAFDLVFGLLVCLFWILLILISRYFIPSTLITAGMIPLMMLVLGMPRQVITYGVISAVLLIYTHRRDIKRIISGRELNTSESIKKYLKK
jgi:glycerol-3-phosphate acyltransferase PlsY